MAKQRVQVEKLRTPTSSGPVARPVDTYVRPTNAPLQKSNMAQLFEALSPSIQRFGETKRKEELELERQKEEEKRKAEAEAERAKRKAEAEQEAKERQKQAFNAKHAFTKFSAEWATTFEGDYDQYIEMDPQQLLEERKQFFANSIEHIFDPLVREALEQDFAIDQLKFEQGFLSKQNAYKAETAVGEVFDTLGYTELSGGDFNEFADEQFSALRQIYDLNGRDLNDMFMDMALSNVSKGDRRMYTYLKSKGQHKVGNPKRQKVVAQIEATIARQDAADFNTKIKEAQAQAKTLAEQTVIDDVIQNGNSIAQFALPTEYQIVNADGSTTIKTISTEEKKALVSRNLLQQNAQEIANTPEGERGNVIKNQAREWYNLGLDNEIWKGQLKKGVTNLSMEFLENPDEVINETQAAYSLFATIYEENEKATMELMGAEDARLFRAIKTLTEYQSLSFEDAFMKVRGLAIDPNAVERVDRSALGDALDDIQDLPWLGTGEALNMSYIRRFVEDNAALDQMSGMTSSIAVENAVKMFEATHTLIGQQYVDTSALRWDSNIPASQVEEAFDAVLRAYQTEDVDGPISFRKIAGQSQSYEIIDEVGLPVIGTPIIRKKDLQQKLNEHLLEKAVRLEEAAQRAGDYDLYYRPSG